MGDALFGDARADEGADEGAGRAARACAGQRRSKWPSNDEAEARDRDRAADRDQRRQHGAHRAADRRADASTLGGLAAQFGLFVVIAVEVAVARFV